MTLHVKGSGDQFPRSLALDLLRPRLNRLLAALAHVADRCLPPFLRLAWRLLNAAERAAEFVSELARGRANHAGLAAPLSAHEEMARDYRRLDANLKAAESWFNLAAAEQVDEAIARVDVAEREAEAFLQQARGRCAVRRQARTWQGRVAEMMTPRSPIRPRRSRECFQDVRILDEVLALRRRFEEIDEMQTDGRRWTSWTRQCA